MLSQIAHNQVLPQIRKIRAQIIKTVRPKAAYSLYPISNKFGYDRGTPIDRWYIECFMEQQQDKVRGHCLEIHDNAYTLRFGQKKVSHSDVADIDTKNKLANIYVDLSKADQIPDNTYDTLIITHTIGLIPEHDKAIAHLYRILKPGGTLLLTVSALGPYITDGNAYWRYTPRSIPYLLEQHFNKENITVQTFGNVLSGQAFWVGMAAEELTKDQLLHQDNRYPVIITAVATK